MVYALAMQRLATAQLITVVDGDTLHCLLDIGWGIVLRPRGKDGSHGTVRITFPDATKYDAPESSTFLGRKAVAYARTLVQPGMNLPVLSHALDDFGRTLGSVTLPDGRDWATVMTESGYVKAH